MSMPKAARPVDLGRVVGQQADRADAEVAQDRRPDAVLPQVDGQAQLEVGVDGVEALVLQLVGPQLVGDADAPALVTAQVHDDAAALGGDHLHRRVELRPAVTAPRAEDVAGQALAVHPHEHLVGAVDVAADSARWVSSSMSLW